MNEFLKLENRLIIKLKIKPKAPLLIKLGSGKEEESNNVIMFMTTETPRIPREKKKIEELVTYTKEKDEILKDERKGEPFIPGSTLRGLFRERFNRIYEVEIEEESEVEEKEIETETEIDEKNTEDEKKENEKIKNLFGFTNDKNEKNTEDMRKGRIFIDDAYLENEEYRKAFFEEDNNALNIKNQIIKTRSITPIDSFTGKATVPLKFEYIEENFKTSLVVNNITKEELQNIYFVIRDSLLGEIRIGNSKTRGFGQVELNIEEFIFENYCTNEKGDDYSYIENFKKFFEQKNEKSIKIGDNYLMEYLVLKDVKVDIENPSEFILTLFEEV